MEKIIINIDSRFSNKKLYNNSSKFTLNLDNTIKNVYDINITSFEFINLYYTFSNKKNNNSFTFVYDSELYNLIIPDGFYQSNDLINIIQTSFDNLTYGVFNISINSDNGKITISSNNPFKIDFSNNSYVQSLGYLLGFRNNKYNPSFNSSISRYSITSEGLLNISGDNYLFLKINDYGNLYTNFYYDIENVLVPKKILAKLILSVNKTQTDFDNNSFISKKFIFRQPVNISKFDIELLDPHGNTLDLNYMDFSFTIELNYLYQNESY